MSAAHQLNERRYRVLLGKALPVVIRTEPEYRRIMALIDALINKDEEEVTEEEGRLLELLAMLAEDYEDRTHPLPKGQPGKMLAHLLSDRGLKAGDISHILPRSRVSEILSGKRSISKSQAKALAEFFGVPVDLFL